MKKIFLFAGMAALLASCANQETVEMAQSNAIGFNAYVGKATRADMTATTLTSFDVYGYYGDGTVVFDKTAVTKSSDSWVTNQTAYWIPNQVYNFAAVAPTTASASFSTNGLILSDYVPSGTDDLIVALTNPITAKGTDNDAVELIFKHALAKVQLNLKKLEGQEFSDVKLNGVINKGTLTATYEAGAVLSWEAGTETTDYTISDTSEALYLMPQELTDNVKVTLTADGISKEYTVKQTAVEEWETGHVYTYLIDLTSDLEEIQIIVGDIDDYTEQSPETDEPTEPEPEEPADLTLTDDIYVDFCKAPNDQPTDTWNIISDINATNVVLKYENGDESTAKLSTSGFEGTYEGAGSEQDKTITSSSIEWPKGVWKDSFYVGSATGLGQATITISDLNPNQVFDITVLATRWNATHTARTTEFEIGNTSYEIFQGMAGQNDGFIWDNFDFDGQSKTFQNVQVSQEGEIEIKIEGKLTVAQAGCISAMVISPVED